MIVFARNKDRDRYYLFAQARRKAHWRKNRLNLQWSITAGLVTSILVAVALYWLSRAGHWGGGVPVRQSRVLEKGPGRSDATPSDKDSPFFPTTPRDSLSGVPAFGLLRSDTCPYLLEWRFTASLITLPEMPCAEQEHP